MEKLTEAQKAFKRRYERAKTKRGYSESLLDECYELTMPLRERPNRQTPGRAGVDRLFDGTAPDALQDLASQMLDDVWPVDGKPFDLVAGKDVDPADREQVDRQLAEVTEEIIGAVNNSNFRAAAHEALCDWGIGTGILIPERGDVVSPIMFRCLPLAEAYLDTGAHDQVDALFRILKVRAGDVLVRWPTAVLSLACLKQIKAQPDEMFEFVEGVERDTSAMNREVWRHRILMTKPREYVILESEMKGPGSKPFIDFHYMRTSNEILGRGPVQLALPDIKTLNLAKEMLLEAADLAINPPWLYDDAGTVNTDTLVIAPRTLIPRMPGTKGLEPLEVGTDTQLSELMLERLQQQIRRTMLGDDLGPVKNTPMSATEVLERTANRAKRRAGPYSRLIVELLFATVNATAWHLRELGRIKLPAIDGRTISFRPLSPLTRAQAQDEILRYDRFMELANARVGPQQTGLFVDAQAYLEKQAKLFGIDPRTQRAGADRKAIATALAAMSALPNDQGQAA